MAYLLLLNSYHLAEFLRDRLSRFYGIRYLRYILTMFCFSYFFVFCVVSASCLDVLCVTPRTMLEISFTLLHVILLDYPFMCFDPEINQSIKCLLLSAMF